MWPFLEENSQTCEESFERYSDLRSHIKLAHPKKEIKSTVCEICQGQFKSRMSLKRHMLLHNENRAIFICGVDGCNKSFSTVGNRRGHIKTAHDGIVVKYPCDKEGCDRSFWHKHLLRKHLLLHESGNNEDEELLEGEDHERKKRKTDFFGTFVGDQLKKPSFQ